MIDHNTLIESHSEYKGVYRIWRWTSYAGFWEYYDYVRMRGGSFLHKKQADVKATYEPIHQLPKEAKEEI